MHAKPQRFPMCRGKLLSQKKNRSQETSEAAEKCRVETGLALSPGYPQAVVEHEREAHGCPAQSIFNSYSLSEAFLTSGFVGGFRGVLLFTPYFHSVGFRGNFW